MRQFLRSGTTRGSDVSGTGEDVGGGLKRRSNPKNAPSTATRVRLLTPEGAVREVDLAADSDTVPFVWMDIEGEFEAQIRALSERIELDGEALEDVLDIVELLPKVEHLEGEHFVVLHSLDRAAEHLDTGEIDCFVSTKRLITVRAHRSRAVESLWTDVASNPDLRVSGEHLFAHLAERIGRRFLKVMWEFERRIDAVGEAALTGDPWVLSEIQSLRREEVVVRGMLRPQLLAISTLRNPTGAGFADEATVLLGDAEDVHRQIVEGLAATRQLLADALDTYRGAVAERQANATVLMSLFASVILPLTLIAGWYGMNIAGLPFADRPWGWVAIAGIMMAVAALTLGLFARLGLLSRKTGRPRR